MIANEFHYALSGKQLSCRRRGRSGSCVLAPRRLRSFPLYTSSPLRRSERRASRRARHLTRLGGVATTDIRPTLPKLRSSCRHGQSPVCHRSRRGGEYTTGGETRHHASQPWVSTVDRRRSHAITYFIVRANSTMMRATRAIAITTPPIM
ncbi:unnamed protein product [Leptidea sinapis]|uniref:Uncharacterized protein n=1 Tax=Leptidea sinapis TaxID=189913 RepID=A0A5E4PRF6_9NEOP|nr:unnamed protein product [Leptidea sinapis]